MKRLALIIAIVGCVSCESKPPAGPTPLNTTTTTVPPTMPTLQSVTLAVAVDGMRAKGDVSQTTATGTFSNGSSQNVTSTCSNWQSDNITVLTINSGGLITAQASGASTITTTCQGVFSSRLVTLALGPRTSFGSGQYLVGPDIAAGRYFSVPRSGCYWERQSGLGGTIGEILANEFVGFAAGQWIVDILRSDLAFETDADCGVWNQSLRRGLQADITPGVWMVGSQITPGRYRTNAAAGCYWERNRHFQNTIAGIIANDFIGSAGQAIVDIRASDAGFQSDDDCGTWTRISSVTSLTRDDVQETQSPAEIEANRERYRQKSGVR